MNTLRCTFTIHLAATFQFAITAICPAAERPNVLIAISDDQSYPHASAYGEPVVQTPAFDQVARKGILFRNAFTPCPGCSPMRAAFLTGQHVWQIRQAGTHASSFPRDLQTFTVALEDAGYHVGYTGKPWGPGNYKVEGWENNPVGKAYAHAKMKSPEGISATDYATNFEQFLDSKNADMPFCFWYGGHEPHRSFGKGLGRAAGMRAEDVNVPGFLPDSMEVRSDMLDYFAEIQWFDNHLARMLETLKQRGLLENTLVVVTSDNGMAFPRAKANLYEYGIHMPLAISWPAGIAAAGRDTDALVSLIDVTATIYDVCSVSPAPNQPLSGHSLLPILQKKADSVQDAVFSGRERHSSSRYNSLGYPCRCIRTKDYLYIRNFTPERWPAGAPQKYASVTYSASGEPVDAQLDAEHGGYHDIDACPTLTWMIEHRSEPGTGELLNASVQLRPMEELYDIRNDSACMVNLANSQEHADALAGLRSQFEQKLRQTGDLRLTDPAAANAWEQFPRYSSLRWFPKPSWAEDAPEKAPLQPWLEQRRPRSK